MSGAGARPEDNRDRLVRTVVAGVVAPARLLPERAAAGRDGTVAVLPGHGGVTLGVRAGDRVGAVLGDHLLAGAALEDPGGTPAVAGPLHLLSCVGNVVRSADGRPLGIVSGKRGGLAPGFWGPQHVVMEADPDRLATLVDGVPVSVLAEGRGLALPAWPRITLLNCSPWLLDRLPLRQDGNALTVDVRGVIPAVSAGAGIGQDGWVGDLEIADPDLEAELDLRFGDLVCFEGVDGAHGRCARPDSRSVGIVSHGPSPVPGHGTGVTLLLSGPADELRVTVDGDTGTAEELRRWTEDNP